METSLENGINYNHSKPGVFKGETIIFTKIFRTFAFKSGIGKRIHVVTLQWHNPLPTLHENFQ